MLDPHPTNELGCGLLDPATEARMLADGLVFAVRLTGSNGKSFVFGGRRPLRDWLHDYVASLAPIQPTITPHGLIPPTMAKNTKRRTDPEAACVPA